MKEKILFVDDEVNVLKAYKRSLRGKYPLDCVSSGQLALEQMEKETYALIISDMNMPEMNGVELLQQVKEKYPETVRVMLTGNADQKTAIEAVNKGDIFRFLNKPCPPELFVHTIQAGLEQYNLIIAERELLEGTLNGSINVLTELLSLVNPEAFGRTSSVKKHVIDIGTQMQIENPWHLEALSALALIGCVVLSEEASRKVTLGQTLSAEESQLFQMHPSVGAELVSKIPRMSDVAASIQYQEKHFDGSGYPNDEISGKDIPLGARILKVVLDFDRKQASGSNSQEAFESLQQHRNRYDPDILASLEVCLQQSEPLIEARIQLNELVDGMILSENVFTNKDVLVTCAGQEITKAVRKRFFNLYSNQAIGAFVHVKIREKLKDKIEQERMQRRQKKAANA